MLEALPTALWATVWSGLSSDPSVRALYAAGIVPILSRLVLEGTPGPFPATAAAGAEGTFQFVRADDGRFLLEMWSNLSALKGSTYAPRGAARGIVPELAGSVFAEHVLTRPFAPAGERRVTSLNFEGAPEIREVPSARTPVDALAAVPEGARPLEPARSIDPVPITFGVVHTDSNLHVNSLVYLRLFEEAALRRFVALGLGAAFLGRAIDIAYRKPSFVGQTVRVVQQAFEAAGRLGVGAVLVAENDTVSDDALAAARPLAYVRMQFEA